MKRTHTKTLTVVLTLTFVTGLVLVLSGFGPFEGPFAEKVAKELKLTEQQRAQIEEHNFEIKKAVTRAQADLEIAEMELEKALEADEVDHEAIMKKLDEIGKIRTEIQKKNIERLLHAKSVLTPEQKEKWAEMKDDVQRRVRAFREKRGNAPGTAFREHMQRGSRGQERPMMRDRQTPQWDQRGNWMMQRDFSPQDMSKMRKFQEWKQQHRAGDRMPMRGSMPPAPDEFDEPLAPPDEPEED